jgi:hypothetical protein
MVGSVTDSQSSNTLGLSPQPATPSKSADSFLSQLTSALEGYLAQSGNNSNLEIDIQSTQSQDSGVRQFLVTVKNPDSAASALPSVASAVSPAASAVSPAASTAPAAAPTNEMDAYWAAQPPEVQKLRDISGLAARSAMAQTLADQGFKIDTQIMVWGWDPMKTMAVRQMYGYSWTPSWGQKIEPTQNDPSAPPPGTIAVNTDFAPARAGYSLRLRTGDHICQEHRIADSQEGVAVQASCNHQQTLVEPDRRIRRNLEFH